MISDLTFLLTLLSALGCGLIAGVFFAFSTFVMKALTRLPPAQGMAAMQTINVTVLNRWFLGVFVGTAVACALLVALSLFSWSQPGAITRLIGGTLYLVGTFLATIVGNIPRNNALAAVEANSPAGAKQWAQFVPGWTAWNHVRTLAALASAAVLTLAIG